MNTVRLMHYDPRWKQEFQQTRSSVLQSCLGLVADVQHIGSTAISGLIARPTIDALAVLGEDHREQSGTLDEAADLIEGLNFRREPAPSWAADTVLLIKPRHGDETHRIFLMKDENQFWRQAIAIRDHLQENLDVATRFEQSKIDRWRSGSGDQDRYSADKAIFFTHLIDQLGP